MDAWSRFVGSLALALTLAHAGCGGPDSRSQAAVPTSPPTAAGDVPTTAAPSAVLLLAGVTRSAEEVRIHANVDGTALDVLVREGDMVKAGDPLVILVNPELSHGVEQAAAAHEGASARAQAADVDSRMNALERATSLRVAELEYEGAQVSADISRHESTRYVENDQAKNMAFSLTDVERSRSSLLRARNRLTQAQLQRGATAARGASVALNLAKTDRERQRMEELQSKNFASASAAEEAELSHANALSRSEEYKRDLAARDEDVKAAQDQIESAQERLNIWEEALGHGVAALQGMKESREAIHTRMGQVTESSGVRLEATRAAVDLDAARSGFFAAASHEAAHDADAAAQVAGQQVAWLRVLAPGDGVVVALNVAVGELVRSARTGADAGEPLLTLADPNRVVARVPVDASDLGRVVVGASVTVVGAGGGGASVVGSVASVAPAPGDNSVYIATIVLPDAGDIGVGSVVHVEFP
jgi:multidrug efflux pump subunit AcrA (membrane-fusion protein)